MQNILSAMDRMVHDKTSLFIAHRLSTIVDAKEIFVLQDGRMIESGSHAQLITRPHSLYVDLWAKQNSRLDTREMTLAHDSNSKKDPS